jgi:hypothetical protein
MWQRIQTVFLATVILCLIATIFFPIWVHKDASSGEWHKLYPLQLTTQNDFESQAGAGAKKTIVYFPYAITAILAIASATIAFIEIRKFKDRMLQMKMGALNSLFMAGTITSAVIFSNQLMKTYSGGIYGFGLWLPGIAVICNLLANRFIRRDEKLVRDSNRLR